MNKIIVLILICCFNTLACDVCSIFEYANRANKSYIGMFYRYRFFNGYQSMDQNPNFFANYAANSTANSRVEHEPQFDETVVNKTQKDYQQFQTAELRFNYSLKSKWNLGVIIPFLWSNVYYNQTFTFPKNATDTTLNVSGLGDFIFTADYVKTFYTGMVVHTIKPGIAIKVPTGNNAIQKNGRLYDYDLQAGTGSVDFILRMNYLVTNDKLGSNTFINYRINTKNSNNLLFGNKWNFMSNVYYTFTINKLKILPTTGVYFEWGGKDKLNNEKITFTGGYSLFTQFGADIMIDKIIVQLLFQIPTFENLNGPVIGNAGRLQIGLVYSL